MEVLFGFLMLVGILAIFSLIGHLLKSFSSKKPDIPIRQSYNLDSVARSPVTPRTPVTTRVSVCLPEIVDSRVDSNLSTSVNTQPRKRVVDVKEGNYRVFINVHKDGNMYTLGYPKTSSTLNDVWVGQDTEELDRISIEEANAMLGNGVFNTPLLGIKTSSSITKAKGISYNKSSKKRSKAITPKLYGNKTGRCLVCGKTLKGNTKKTHCTECYHKLNTD